MTDKPGLNPMPLYYSPDPTGFEQWMARSLKQRYDWVLREPLPEELVTLLGEDDPS